MISLKVNNQGVFLPSLPQIEYCDADTPGDLSAQFLASPSLAHTRHEKKKELKRVPTGRPIRQTLKKLLTLVSDAK